MALDSVPCTELLPSAMKNEAGTVAICTWQLREGKGVQCPPSLSCSVSCWCLLSSCLLSALRAPPSLAGSSCLLSALQAPPSLAGDSWSRCHFLQSLDTARPSLPPGGCASVTVKHSVDSPLCAGHVAASWIKKTSSWRGKTVLISCASFTSKVTSRSQARSPATFMFGVSTRDKTGSHLQSHRPHTRPHSILTATGGKVQVKLSSTIRPVSQRRKWMLIVANLPAQST